MTEPSGQDIFDILDSDHRAILGLVDRAGAEHEPDELAALCEQLVMEVVRHFVAEEQYLLPLVRARLAGGEKHSDDAFAEHRAVEDELRKLEHAERDPGAVHPLLAKVRAGLKAHIARQHDSLFPALRASVERLELDRLADEVLGAEQLAPTRPRELRPESPAANKLLSYVEGWVDRVRDSFSRRGVEPERER